MNIFNRLWIVIAHKRGAQTIEYVAVMAGAALLGLILLTIIESDEIQSALKEKIECAITQECGDSQNILSDSGGSVTRNASDPSGQKPTEEEGFFDMFGRKAGEAWDSFTEVVSNAWDETKDGFNYLWENAKQEVNYEVDGLKGATTFKEGLEQALQTTLRLTPLAGPSAKLEKLTGFDLIGWVSENPGTVLLNGAGVALLFIPGGQGGGVALLGNTLRTVGWGILSGSAAGGLFTGLSGGDVSDGMLVGGLAGAISGGVGALAIRYGTPLASQFLRSPWAQRWIPIGGSGAVAGGSEEAAQTLIRDGKVNWKNIIAAGLIGTIMGVGGGLLIDKVAPHVTQALQNRGIFAGADGTLSHPNIAGNAGDVAEDAADGYRRSQGSGETSTTTRDGAKVTSAEGYASRVSNRTTVTGEYPDSYWEKGRSKILRDELKAAGVEPPPYPNAAHHIVPWDDPRAVQAQRILREYGIDTESAVNGVFLPYEKGSKYVGDEALHRGNHGESYVREVNNRLEKLQEEGGTREDIVHELNQIRKELLDGSLSLN